MYEVKMWMRIFYLENAYEISDVTETRGSLFDG